MNEMILSPGEATITSREIAELVDSRHDSVKRTIERLVNQGVIEFPPTVEIQTSTNTGTAYLFTGERGKRDSIPRHRHSGRKPAWRLWCCNPAVGATIT